jgi:cell division protein FtsA
MGKDERKRNMAVKRNGIVAALDVGTSKVCCFVARVQAPNEIRVIGIGHQVSAGMRAGTVVNMEGAEHAVRAAVDAAEKMANETIRDVVVNLSGGYPTSHTVGVEIPIAGREVTDADLRKVLEQGRARPESGEREVIHSIPVGYTIDGSRGIRDPRGMYGDRLGVNMHVITAAGGPKRNLSVCVERCHLNVEAIVVSPFAAGLASLVPDEKELGVTLIDMGGGTTTMAVFIEGSLVHVDSVPIGGAHVTNDIARGLSTPTAHAERMKTLYGSALPSPEDEREMIDVPQVGESERHSANHVPRSVLTGIIRPRLEETFELVRDRLRTSGFDRVAGRRVVLTGGACQLHGVREMAAQMLDKQVRIGRPIDVSGLAEAAGGPAFATCTGLIAFAARDHAQVMQPAKSPEIAPRGGFAKFGHWLKENF